MSPAVLTLINYGPKSLMYGPAIFLGSLELVDFISGDIHIWKDHEPYQNREFPMVSRHDSYTFQSHHILRNQMIKAPTWNLYGRFMIISLLPTLLTYLPYYMGWIDSSTLLTID